MSTTDLLKRIREERQKFTAAKQAAAEELAELDKRLEEEKARRKSERADRLQKLNKELERDDTAVLTGRRRTRQASVSKRQEWEKRVQEGQTKLKTLEAELLAKVKAVDVKLGQDREAMQKIKEEERLKRKERLLERQKAKVKYGKGYEAWKKSREVENHVISSEASNESEFYGCTFTTPVVQVSNQQTRKEVNQLKERELVANLRDNDRDNAQIFVKALEQRKVEKQQQPVEQQRSEEDAKALNAKGAPSVKKWTLNFEEMDLSLLFSECLKDHEGLTVWHIDHLELVQDNEFPHSWQTRECYILLYSERVETREKLNYTIVTVIGPSAPMDKKFCVSLYSVALRTFLGSSDRIRRVDLDDQDEFFQELLNKAGIVNSLSMEEGGGESALFKVNYGSENHRVPVRCYQIKTLALQPVLVCPRASTFDSESVYIVEKDAATFIWIGRSAKRNLIAKVQMAYKTSSTNAYTVIEQGDEPEEFHKLFAKQKDTSTSETTSLSASTPTLYKVSMPLNSDISAHVVPRLSRNLLETDGVFVLDAYNELTLWTGKQSSLQLRDLGRELLARVVAVHPRPTWTSVRRFAEDSEGWMFRWWFADWDYRMVQRSPRESPSKRKVEVDMSAMFNTSDSSSSASVSSRSNLEAIQERIAHWQHMISNITIFRFQKGKFIAVASDSIIDRGVIHLDASETYLFLVLYQEPKSQTSDDDTASVTSSSTSSTERTSTECILYFWNGRYASPLAWSIFQFSARNDLEQAIKDRYDVQLSIMKVDEGKEPLSLVAPYHCWTVTKRSKETTRTRMFHLVFDRNVGIVRAAEVQPKARHLVTRDAFLVLCNGSDSTTQSYLWVGGGISRDERRRIEEALPGIVEGITYQEHDPHSLETIRERFEPKEFWKCLGGKETYGKGTEFHFLAPPRVFAMHFTSGNFVATEVTNFTQLDLKSEYCVFLDPGAPNAAFFWVGSQASVVLKEMGRRAIIAYFGREKDGRKITGVVDPNQEVKDYLAWIDSERSRILSQAASANVLAVANSVSTIALDQPHTISSSKTSLDKLSKSRNVMPAVTPSGTTSPTKSPRPKPSQTVREGDLITIQEGCEPIEFTSYFLAWDPEYRSSPDRPIGNSFLNSQLQQQIKTLID